jgi:hypothetical protein
VIVSETLSAAVDEAARARPFPAVVGGNVTLMATKPSSRTTVDDFL